MENAESTMTHSVSAGASIVPTLSRPQRMLISKTSAASQNVLATGHAQSGLPSTVELCCEAATQASALEILMLLAQLL